MKTSEIFLSLTIILLAFSCTNQNSGNPEKWSEKELNQWFEKGEWKQGWEVSADETVNRKEFAKQYFLNKERWDKAFAFLKNNDLVKIEPDRYELEGDSLFVNINDYEPKNDENSKYEAHRKYADIQYLASGEERIGVLPLSKMEVIEPFKKDNDACFLKTTESNFRLASSDRFFIFLPDDAHLPGVKVKENATVRKIVVKVLINPE